MSLISEIKIIGTIGQSVGSISVASELAFLYYSESSFSINGSTWRDVTVSEDWAISVVVPPELTVRSVTLMFSANFMMRQGQEGRFIAGRGEN